MPVFLEPLRRPAHRDKARAGRLNRGSIGIGGWYDLLMEKLLVRLGIEDTHMPCCSEAAVLADFVAGQNQLMMQINRPPTGGGQVKPS